MFDIESASASVQIGPFSGASRVSFSFLVPTVDHHYYSNALAEFLTVKNAGFNLPVLGNTYTTLPELDCTAAYVHAGPLNVGKPSPSNKEAQQLQSVPILSGRAAAEEGRRRSFTPRNAVCCRVCACVWLPL